MDLNVAPLEIPDLTPPHPGDERALDRRVVSTPSAGEPFVSVILAVHNRESCVARAIESVLSQTYRNVELIVVDDGSTDRTAQVAQRYGKRVRLLHQPHAGAYAARNLGLEHAGGELIAFIDSDDAWLPHRLSSQVPLMRRRQVGLVFGDTIHVTAPRDGAPRTGRTSFQVSPPSRGRVGGRFSWANFVPTCTVLVRRSCLEEIGGFSRSSLISCDYLAWYRIAQTHELDHVDEPVSEYTVHAQGISFDLGRSLAARIRLFSGELERASDDRSRRTLRRLLFNLSLHLGLAVPRGRATSVAHPLRLAWKTAWRAAGFRAGAWGTMFALHLLAARARRLLR
jgi:glycosyltransferase involved in cell wall biosynthesis